MPLFFIIYSFSCGIVSAYIALTGGVGYQFYTILSMIGIVLYKMHSDENLTKELAEKNLTIHLLKRYLEKSRRNDMPNDPVTGKFTKKKK